MNWHSVKIEEILKKFNTDIKYGLSEKKVLLYRKKFGENKISKEERLSNFKIFIDQIKSPLIYVLLVAGLILLFFKETRNDSFVIFFAVLISIFFGFWEEKKASNILFKLKKLLKTKAIVIRDGRRKEIFQEEVVPGDIIFIKEGDKIPADARLIEAENLKVSEAVLTGESISSEKRVKVLPQNTPLADRENMVYAGCMVEKGRGIGIVVATGDKTEVGKIAKMLHETEEEKTPLQRRLEVFSKKTTLIVIFLCIFIFISGIFREKEILKMFETSVALAVGAIPEALPITLTVILALGAERILKEKGLIRRLTAVEALGSTEIICTDKTKTLTEGKMIPENIILVDGGKIPIKNIKKEPFFDSLFKVATFCNEAFIEIKKQRGKIKKILRGEETDKGLLRAGILYGYEREAINKETIILKRIAFTFKRKYQAVFVKDEDNCLYVSGAPEKLLSLSKKIETKSGIENLDEIKRKKILKLIDKETEKGFRVIGLAKKIVKEGSFSEKLVNNLTFIGVISLKDPLRKDVKKVIKTAMALGLSPVIITGDHKNTAKNIASELGLKIKDNEILEGKEIDELSDKVFRKIVKKIKIYARAEPRHKMKIVDALQKLGKVVAMTGDGVNDAPALKSADVGVGLGSGTEIAKEASDIVLLNDNFSVIVSAIEQGRIILDNLKKAIAYTIADSFSAAAIVGISTIFLGWPLPILPVQILWNNVLEDTLPNIALAFEPGEKNIMERLPEDPRSSFFGRRALFLMMGNIIFNFLCIFYFWFFWKYLNLGLDFARTMIFGVLCVDTAFVIFSYKNLKRNIWEINPFSNKFLNISAIFSILGFALVVYVPFLRNLFHTVPIGFLGWLFLIANGIFTMFFLELIKFLIKKKK